MGFRGYQQLSMQFNKTDGIGYISCIQEPHNLGDLVRPLDHSTLLLCLTGTAVGAHALSPLSSSLGCVSFLPWRRMRGVNSWD